MPVERAPVGVKARVDLDRTVAGGAFPLYMAAYIAEFGLEITPEEIALYGADPTIRSSDVPQVQEYRQRGPAEEAEYQRVYRTVSESVYVHKHQLTPIDESQPGVEYIRSEFGNVGYDTVRPRVVEEATHWWLHRNDYPNPDKVVISKSPPDKLFKILWMHVLEYGSGGINVPRGIHVVLWDDGFKGLIEAADEVADRYPLARRALGGVLLVGFGAESNRVHRSDNLQIVNQQSWQGQHLYPAVAQVKDIISESRATKRIL